jgi:hypothetical protein
MASNAQTAARAQDAGGVFIEHTTIVDDDIEWLAEVERLTLWNVKVPEDFLPRLSRLWWIDWRGGGKSQNVEQLQDCPGLRYVSLNQIRGLSDLSLVSRLTTVEMLQIYGLSAVQGLPSFAGLSSLRRLELGQLKRIEAIRPALDAPLLEELLLIRAMNVTPEDIVGIQSHATLRLFDWFAEGVPDRTWVPVRQAITLPRARFMHPDEWFDARG